ncbi:restriction enzyme subunit beta/N-6 DNA methylase [Flammeovirgaceae bacterium 311]|nr:restriction enzyme subunit beta/N-6 DNA methylase [Flammeovirgaceae bacterium 311]
MNSSMEMDLKDVHWGKFVIQDLFTIKIGKNVDGNKVDKNGGQVAYITRKESENGLDGFIDYKEEYLNVDRPVITIGNETAEPFVQEYPFFTGTKVNILISKNNVSKEALLFISQSLKLHKSKYSYSYTINSTRLKRQIIQLPINSEGNPDYAFMELYIRQKELEKTTKFQNYIAKRIEEVKDFKIVDPLHFKEWGGFEIGKLFKLFQGKSKGLNHLTKTSYGINYLGATNSNNGVLAYVQPDNNEKMIQRGNCIAFIRNGEGSMGFSIYKAENFIATSDISVGYSEFLNREIGLFITTIADKIRGKYNFGYKRSDTRLKKEKLQLPLDKNGQPDYDYMENYIKKLEYEKLSKYLKRKTKDTPKSV